VTQEPESYGGNVRLQEVSFMYVLYIFLYDLVSWCLCFALWMTFFMSKWLKAWIH